VTQVKCSYIAFFGVDTNPGDNWKASIAAEARETLAAKLERLQRVKMQRVKGFLGIIEVMPTDAYLKSTRQYLQGQLGICENKNCTEERDVLAVQNCLGRRIKSIIGVMGISSW